MNTYKLGKTYLSTISKNWPNEDYNKPGKTAVVALDVSTEHFKRNAIISSFFAIGKYKAELWWEDALQQWVTQTVSIISDNLDEGVYCGYCIQNDPNHFALLGKLKDGHPFTEACRDSLKNHCL